MLELDLGVHIRLINSYHFIFFVLKSQKSLSMFIFYITEYLINSRDIY